MVAGLVRFALARPLVIVVAALVLAAAGGCAYTKLKVEAYPDLTDATVVVVTLYPGFAAEEVERQVTMPLERALNNTPYVIGRRSRTIFGLSVVELTFEDGTNDYLARQLVLERLAPRGSESGRCLSVAPFGLLLGPSDGAAAARGGSCWLRSAPGLEGRSTSRLVLTSAASPGVDLPRSTQPFSERQCFSVLKTGFHRVCLSQDRADSAGPSARILSRAATVVGGRSARLADVSRQAWPDIQ